MVSYETCIYKEIQRNCLSTEPVEIRFTKFTSNHLKFPEKLINVLLISNWIGILQNKQWLNFMSCCLNHYLLIFPGHVISNFW